MSGYLILMIKLVAIVLFRLDSLFPDNLADSNFRRHIITYLSTVYLNEYKYIKASYQVLVGHCAYYSRIRTHFHFVSKIQQFGGVAVHFVDATLFVVADVVADLSIAHDNSRNLKLYSQVPLHVILELHSQSLILKPRIRGHQFCFDYRMPIQGMMKLIVNIG